MILQLAVMGKLVPQDPADEPASVLLQRIAAEKDRLIRDGKIKRPKPLPAIRDDEKPFELPQGWEWVRLNDLGEWGAGATPLRSKPEYYGGNIPWFKSGELTGDLISKSEETVTELALKECSLRLNKKGDILIAMYGATIGKTSILDIEATTNQAVCACTLFSDLNTNYLLLLLKAYKPMFIGMGAGGAQPNISREKIINTAACLPPLEEQKRIVAKVDSLMALCDKLETLQQQRQQLDPITHNAVLQSLAQTPDDLQRAWQRLNQHMTTLFHTPESVKALRETILQLAVMGKLVPQDPHDEPAAVLLQHIATEKDRLIQEGKIKRQKPLPAIRDDEKPFELPKGWEWVRIDDIFNVQGGIQKTPKRKPINNYFPYLRVANVQRGYMTLDQIEYFEIEDGELEKYTLNEGDILIVEGNGSAEEIGRCAIWHDQIKNCVHQNHLIRIRGFFVATGLFSTKFLNSPLGISEMKRLSITTSGLYTLSVGKIRSICIPLPPLAEQKRIVAKVDSLMALCDKLEKRLQAARETAGLFAAEAVNMTTSTAEVAA